MALITCKKCGKKISDTVEKCIHCGAPVSDMREHKENKTKDVSDNPNAEEKMSKLDYNTLDEDTRIRLEKEFLEADKRAKLYRRRGLEIEKLKTLCCCGLFVPMFFVLVARLCYFYVFEQKIANQNILALASFVAVILFGVSVVSGIVLGVITRIHGRAEKQIIYVKKYQKWLSEEKNISYSPMFVLAKYKNAFEKIDLSKVDL